MGHHVKLQHERLLLLLPYLLQWLLLLSALLVQRPSSSVLPPGARSRRWALPAAHGVCPAPG
jgi:hypothetical protein